MLEMKCRGAGKAKEAMKSRGSSTGNGRGTTGVLKVQLGLLQGSHSLEREGDQCAGKKGTAGKGGGGQAGHTDETKGQRALHGEGTAGGWVRERPAKR